ncbi:TPA: type 1 fimbrial protein [Stenotrophomonas maltophilia]|nr:type 1 fimbrial protein [Stenotrophomonas maltophilia]
MSMISSRGRKALTTLALLGGVLLAQQAQAACRLLTAIPTVLNFDLRQVVIRPSTPVGGTIISRNLPIRQQNFVSGCDPSGGAILEEYVHSAQKVPVPGFSDVYETEMPGVGVRVRRSGSTFPIPTTIIPPGQQPMPIGWEAWYEVSLIKTSSRAGSGVAIPQGLFARRYYDGDGPNIRIVSLNFSSPVTTVSSTCEVQAGSRNIAVGFGDVPRSSFTGVGSRAASRDFDIRLSCQGNAAAGQAVVSLRLDADQDGSNMPGVLKLSAVADSATRIGIQLVQRDGGNEREIRFGQPVRIGTTGVGSSVLTLPLRARYVQTQAGTVGAGLANGQATFTLQYN